jgi:hypothetical protein
MIKLTLINIAYYQILGKPLNLYLGLLCLLGFLIVGMSHYLLRKTAIKIRHPWHFRIGLISIIIAIIHGILGLASYF